MQVFFTVIWLWTETMLTMFHNVWGIPQIDEQLQAFYLKKHSAP